jgi:hypothetical protein
MKSIYYLLLNVFIIPSIFTACSLPDDNDDRGLKSKNNLNQNCLQE